MEFDPTYWQPTPRTAAAVVPLPRTRTRYLEDFAPGQSLETASQNGVVPLRRAPAARAA